MQLHAVSLDALDNEYEITQDLANFMHVLMVDKL